ncbi:universal stress protein [Vibrio ponticus]|uniref:Universal stress protein n=1 Tax=Vibrio ponticus TaxID=265668 RepID=A0ABX3FEN1_9VIBR|nr:universal stress protein [Vibrio ponticus]OLQ89028.1 universal stress protein [Vibrio ponticus]
MKEFKNILFVSQGLPENRDSIEQALTLSKRNNASLMGLIVSPALPKNMANYRDAYQQSLRDTLDKEITQVQQTIEDNADLPLAVEIACGDKPALKIIQCVQNHHRDLLIKQAEPINDGAEGFKALDMKLLRKCPCPIWLHRSSVKPHSHKRVAVAIDPIVHSEEDKQLVLQLLTVARSIADSCDSRLHIISCWQYELESYLRHHSWIQIDDEQLNQEIELLRDNHRQQLDNLIEESGIAGEFTVHHINGRADDEIPQCVAILEIDILVMGTIARSGIKGLVMGNTAENILQSLTCSLVALKPQGFVSPIT